MINQPVLPLSPNAQMAHLLDNMSIAVLQIDYGFFKLTCTITSTDSAIFWCIILGMLIL